MTTPKNNKISKLFLCENCNYSTRKNSEYKKHLLTLKHINTTNYNTLDIIIEKEYSCACGKKYNHRASLFNHKKKCNIDENNKVCELTLPEENSNKKDEKIDLLITEHIDFKNIIIELVKSNSDLQKQTLEMQQQLLEVCKNSNTIINNNNNNSNNKTFNMQVFLNEKCKDAMNLMDFVNSMTLDFSDLEELGELGYVEGISRQMMRKLSEMDVYKRPIHCSDLKRETMYVRDNDVWEKETELYDNLRKAIKYITKKNGDLMIPWRNAHPQCMNLQHPLNDKYLGIMNQAMGGKGEFAESESKIIKKISKCVTIDKKDI